MKIACVLLLLTVPNATRAQKSCTQTAEQAAVAALDIQSKLLAITLGPDDLPYDPPPLAKHDVPRLRNALVQTVDAFLLCNAAPTDATKIQSHLANLLLANLPDPPTPAGPPTTPQRDIYGAGLKIKVEPVKALRETIAVQLNFGTGCGDDNILLLYSSVGSAWRRSLDWHKDVYNKASDAFGDFFLYQSLPQTFRPPAIAIAHGQPWCTSRFSGFSTDLLSLATASSPQRLLAHVQESYVREVEPTMRRTVDGVELRLEVSSRDGDRLTRPGVVHFRTTSGKLERVQPAALNPRDFVDAWLDASWPLAKTWSPPNAAMLARLKVIHDRFDYNLRKDTPELTLPKMQACSKDAHYQVLLDLHDHPPLFALVQQNRNSFTLISVTNSPNPSCTGANLLKSD